ncbi:magnesium chelatase subunit D family protein [Methanofollis ethanolicus]|uniref:magnesium chelatase subunit D family protein n=1 Tax=Methanofollis ethanolicus TaxID=488124 RepID=UPI0008322B70|nr:magnesium chelatase subunit D family protein [Methanofollis ethanolicus]
MALTDRPPTLPFTAIIGQDQMKLALILNAINPRVGGVLIRGEKGTAKSTAVRALSGVLPQIAVVQGCPFSCDPDDPAGFCPTCAGKLRETGGLERSERRVRVVTLPLGATEDRVVGTLDLERAIREGVAALEPGVLADAHRGILYIDEVNLLDDHIVDVLLDAAAMGVNTVEREGISVTHPARFMLVGTMNPEEGELRPQLLDRFGLMVTVEGFTDPDARMAVIAAAEAWDRDPAAMAASCAPAQDDLRAAIVRARTLLPGVTIDDRLVRTVVEACISLGITTHRAEITVVRAARTIAAFRGRETVLPADVREAMALALPHRMRRKPFEEPEIDPQTLDDMVPDRDDQRPQDSRDETGGGGEGDAVPPPDGGRTETKGIGAPIATDPVWKETTPDRTLRKTARGRRIATPTEDRRGRRTTVTTTDTWRDLALDATLRAAAPAQRFRKPGPGLAVTVLPQDLRKAGRTGRAEVACVFVVDASGSMGAEKRMECAKGAVFSLLEDAYVHRDRVGLVAFRGTDADLVLPLSRSVDLAYHRLAEIPTGGRTPLAAGLAKGMEVLQREKRKRREVIPLMMLISDGRANSGTGPVREELARVSGEIAGAGIRTVVIDTEAVESGRPLTLGYCREVAEMCGGRYYALSDLSTGEIETIARYEGGRLFET